MLHTSEKPYIVCILSYNYTFNLFSEQKRSHISILCQHKQNQGLSEEVFMLLSIDSFTVDSQQKGCGLGYCLRGILLPMSLCGFTL